MRPQKHFLKNAFLPANLALIASSIVVSLLIMELAVRNFHLGTANMITRFGGNLVEHHYKGLYTYDPQLGWAPMPNVTYPSDGIIVHTQKDGIRSNGNQPGSFKKQPLILAVGDSFTFGEFLPDNLTWPSELERLSQTEVLNAGVSSFGVDQIILRAESLYSKYQPDIIIVAVIFEDIARAGQSVRHGVPKPYFTLSRGELVLNNAHLHFIQNSRLDIFRTIFGHSHLIHKIMSSYFPEYWWKNTMRDIRTIDTDRLGVCKKLSERLRTKIDKNTPIIYVMLPQYNLKMEYYIVLYEFKKYLETQPGNVHVIDLAGYLLAIQKHSPAIYEKFFLPEVYRHISPTGNKLIAQEINKVINQIYDE